MPRQPFLIEGNNNLWALDIGFLGRDQVRLIRVLPVEQSKAKTLIPDVNSILLTWTKQGAECQKDIKTLFPNKQDGK